MSVIIITLQLIVAVLTLPLHVLYYLGMWDSLAKKVHPHILVKFTNIYNKLMEDHKRNLFSNISDYASTSKELRLLEVGCGTGANFKFYPSGCRVTCLDLNPNFKTYLCKSQAENDHLKYEGFLVASADNMTPVADASMDVVVCTLVFCSVPSSPAVLKEIHRVLKPISLTGLDNLYDLQQFVRACIRIIGGAVYFLEHVACTDESSWISFFQKVINPTWNLIFDGCSVRKTTWKDLENAKFSKLNLRHIIAPTSLKLINPHIIGYAVK